MAERELSGEDVAAEVRALLENADLTTLTIKSFKKQLAEKLGRDLSQFKAVIKATVATFTEELNTAHQQTKEEEQQGDDEQDGDHTQEVQDEDKKNNDDSQVSGGKRKRGSNGFQKQMELSPALAQLMGEAFMSRPDVVKRLWEYIKANNLQDPSDRRKILCDNTLASIFKRKSVTMFTMNKYLGDHLCPADEAQTTQSARNIVTEANVSKGRTRMEEEDLDQDDEDSEQAPKKQRKSAKSPKERKISTGSSNRLQPLFKLSEPLSELLSESELSRAQLTKKIWEYIKKRNLQDPKDGRSVICDDSLRKIYGKDRVSMFEMNKLISPHLTRN